MHFWSFVLGVVAGIALTVGLFLWIAEESPRGWTNIQP